MFLKLAYLQHQISAGQLSPDSSLTETLYCLISVQKSNVSSFLQSFEKNI